MPPTLQISFCSPERPLQGEGTVKPEIVDSEHRGALARAGRSKFPLGLTIVQAQAARLQLPQAVDHPFAEEPGKEPRSYGPTTCAEPEAPARCFGWGKNGHCFLHSWKA